jgi:hypothetical protein
LRAHATAANLTVLRTSGGHHRYRRGEIQDLATSLTAAVVGHPGGDRVDHKARILEEVGRPTASAFAGRRLSQGD